MPRWALVELFGNCSLLLALAGDGISKGGRLQTACCPLLLGLPLVQLLLPVDWLRAGLAGPDSWTWQVLA